MKAISHNNAHVIILFMRLHVVITYFGPPFKIKLIKSERYL